MDVPARCDAFFLHHGKSNPEVALRTWLPPLEVVIARAEIDTALDEATQRLARTSAMAALPSSSG